MPGYRPPEGGPAADAERRACAGLTGLVAAAWPAADRPAAGFAWSDFDADLAGHAREEFPGLPPDAVALALRTWGGCTACSPYGHLAPLTAAPGRLYRAEMLDLVRSLGLAAPGEAEG